ncbi:Helix-turn-helix domain-containing protein [Fodinibius salinus]|uniref:Helix-turn-helix domain-containing protein n=1 Tax=Fodinibius salinus TaxID=860790 RepID=A0A5D3YGZ3_9BACT|nr:helix-turn-helix transcriptional regulator [Fodinibius salinus]TYP92691.1 Helix-turn-helix domain-containing protein [Fodinibius salinus]
MESLGNDLARIRKEKELSLDDINKATKIPLHILRSIEDDSIFSDLQESPTYIRSYIRSYAKALSIDEQKIIYALDKKEKGQYSGSLQKILDDSYDQKEKSTFELDEDNSDSSVESTDNAEEQMIHDHSPEFKSDSNDSSDSESDHPESEEEVPTVQTVDWADMGRQFQPLESTKSKVWIFIIGIIIVVGAVIYFFFFNNRFTTSEDTPSTAQTEITTDNTDEPADSLQLNVMPSTPADSVTAINDTSKVPNPVQNTTLSELPDTLHIVLYAAYGKLEPVRVFTDVMDDINPYWLEQGEAYKFNFIDEIQIRGQYSRMELLLNGHPIENLREQFYNPDTRLLEINRSYFVGDSTWLKAAPDSLPIDAPPPSVIKDRPTFN